MTKIFEAIEKASKKKMKHPTGSTAGGARPAGNPGHYPPKAQGNGRLQDPWGQAPEYPQPEAGHGSGNGSWQGEPYRQPARSPHPQRNEDPQGYHPPFNHEGGNSYYSPPPGNQGSYYQTSGGTDRFQPPPENGAPPQSGGQGRGHHQTPPPNGGSNQNSGGPGQVPPGQQPPPPGGPGFVAGPTVRPLGGDLKLVRPLTILFQNISALLPDKPSRTIMMMESRPGEGASVLALEFAKVCAIKLNKRVLLMDADQGRFDLMARYGSMPEVGWGEAVYHDLPLNQAVTQVGDSRLHYTQVSVRQGLPSIAFDSMQIIDILDELKKEFELILVQPPPGLISADGLLMARRVDGVIMVVEAEKTRYQVVERVRDQILTNNGNLLGVILNKRRFPIPRVIYKYL